MASKSQHRTRTSLLGSSGSGDQSYHQLHGNSFSSAAEHRPIVQEMYQAGGYHDREGLPTTPKGSKARGIYYPKSKWTILFTVVVVVQAVVALALEAYVFGKFEVTLKRGNLAPQDASDSRTIPTYLALFIFGFLYQLGLTYDALSNRNTIQIIGLCIYNYGMMIYAAIEMNQVWTAVESLRNSNSIDASVWPTLRPSLIAAPCVIALGSVLMSGIAYKLYQEFAWDIYKSISADLRMRHRYLTYQIYITLLKFDFFFFLGFTVQFLVIVGNNAADVEFRLTTAAIPITIIILLLAAFFCRRESKYGQSFIIFIYFAAMAYFTFKLVRMWDKSNPVKYNTYSAARASLTTFAVITIILVLVTIVVAFMTLRNFDKGLKPYVSKSGRKASSEEHNTKTAYGEDYGNQMGPISGRMVID